MLDFISGKKGANGHGAGRWKKHVSFRAFHAKPGRDCGISRPRRRKSRTAQAAPATLARSVLAAPPAV